MERITSRSHFKDTNGQFYKVRFTVCFACGTSGQIIVMGLFCFFTRDRVNYAFVDFLFQ